MPVVNPPTNDVRFGPLTESVLSGRCVAVITRQQLQELKPRVRIGMVGFLTEFVLGLYSPYFLRTFRVGACQELIGKYVSAGRLGKTKAAAAITDALSHTDQAEAEGYDRWEVALPTLVLSEIVELDGKNAILAIESCQHCYGYQVLRRLGISPFDPFLQRFPQETAALSEPIGNLAAAAFRIAAIAGNKQRPRFDSLARPDPGEVQVPTALATFIKSHKRRRLPPLHERPATLPTGRRPR